MGVYNTIKINCPNCDNILRFQTKSGSCILTEYHITNVPKRELRGIMGKERKCNNCGKNIKIKDLYEEKVDASSLVNCY